MQRRVTGAAGKLRRRIYWSAAAALLLCAGAGGYLLTLRNIPMQEPAIALRQDTPERSVPADSVVLAAATPEKSRPEAKPPPKRRRSIRKRRPQPKTGRPFAKQEAEYAENEKSRPGETVAGTPPPAPSEESLSQDEAALPVAADIAAERSDRPEKCNPPFRSPRHPIPKESSGKSGDPHRYGAGSPIETARRLSEPPSLPDPAKAP